ncbi:MAG TPA: hypothetical protein VLT57_02855, partial [Bryobacteraceae bacterium]|nr:hypothetical protein [Bryobacteraceae bacterium]
RWMADGSALDLTVSGLPGRGYALDVYRSGRKETLPVAIPCNPAGGYVNQTLHIRATNVP